MVPTAFARGPSPRGWGIRGTAAQPCRLPRTIPTRVGNTATGILGFLLSADHPHAGGEYHRMLSPELRGTGPSPRGWGIPQQRGIHDMPDRTIPTRVGNTRPARTSATQPTDHPHAGGEYWACGYRLGRVAGPSPRGWGIQRTPMRVELPSRTIPTRVGNTGSLIDRKS